MKDGQKTCFTEDINRVATLFEQNSTGVPELDHLYAVDGFYFLLLRFTTFETDANAFFQILEVDWRIGWIHPEQVEMSVFRYKAIKIIDDEQVSYKINFTWQTKRATFPFS